MVARSFNLETVYTSPWLEINPKGGKKRAQENRRETKNERKGFSHEEEFKVLKQARTSSCMIQDGAFQLL